MKKRNLRLLSLTSIVLLSTPAFGQVVNGGATGSIGGSLSGTLQRPSAIDRMNSERDRTGHVAASAAGKARQSAEVTTERTRDGVTDTKEKLADRASSVRSDTSATARGAVSTAQATSANSAQSAAHIIASAEVTGEALMASGQLPAPRDTPVETAPASQASSESFDTALDARGSGAADVVGRANDQTQPSDQQSHQSPSSVTLGTDYSGSGTANAVASSGRADSSAQGNAGVHRDGTSLRSDASASGQANAEIKQSN